MFIPSLVIFIEESGIKSIYKSTNLGSASMQN